MFANTNKGDVSLFDYLSRMLGSIRVSDRVPGVSSSAQKGIVVLSASSTPPKIHVWDAMQIVRDPYSGAGAGKVTLTATALVSPLYVPHGDVTGQGSSPEALVRLSMPLRVVQAPGCREIYSDDDLGVRAGDVVIDTGDIAASLGYDQTSPTANKALLRVASRMRGVAIVAANDANLSGIVRTSNPRSVPRLLEQTGTLTATVIPLTRAEGVADASESFSRMTGTGRFCAKAVLIGISAMSEHHRVSHKRSNVERPRARRVACAGSCFRRQNLR